MATKLMGKRIFIGIIGLIERVLGSGAYIALGIVMISMIANVFMRYVFNDPINGVFEFNSLLVPVFAFLAFAETQRRRGHIGVTLLTRRLTPRAELALEIFVFALGFTAFLLIGLQSLQAAVYAHSINQVVMGSYPPVPTAWAKFIIPVRAWAFCLRYIREIVNNIVQLRLKEAMVKEAEIIGV